MSLRETLSSINGVNIASAIADGIANAPPKVQVAVGGGLMTTPGWMMLFQGISIVASTIAAICGAIIGVYGVYRLLRPKP